jgi:hypothetical protein
VTRSRAVYSQHDHSASPLSPPPLPVSRIFRAAHPGAICSSASSSIFMEVVHERERPFGAHGRRPRGLIGARQVRWPASTSARASSGSACASSCGARLAKQIHDMAIWHRENVRYTFCMTCNARESAMRACACARGCPGRRAGELGQRKTPKCFFLLKYYIKWCRHACAGLGPGVPTCRVIRLGPLRNFRPDDDTTELSLKK